MYGIIQDSTEEAHIGLTGFGVRTQAYHRALKRVPLKVGQTQFTFLEPAQTKFICPKGCNFLIVGIGWPNSLVPIQFLFIFALAVSVLLIMCVFVYIHTYTCY